MQSFIPVALGLFGLAIASPAKDPSVPYLVQGRTIDLKEAPFHVSIQQIDGRHACGGTIIGDRWVLTSAKCASRYVTLCNINFWGPSKITQKG